MSGTDLSGVAVITGAASGIGRATAIAFATAGCTQIALLDVNETGLGETRRLVQGELKQKSAIIEVFQCNVSSEESVVSAYAAVKKTFTRIDYSVHCAGIGILGNTVDISVVDFDKQLSINYRGVWLCSREVIKIMLSQPLDSEAYPAARIPHVRGQRGSIINISSTLAIHAQRNMTVYSAVKAAVLGLTRSDAIDYATERIRVNSILPGIIDSPMNNPSPEARQWLLDNVVAKTPYKRFGLPEEIAEVVVFLAGNKASFISGASWCADGGLTAGYS